MAENFIFRKTLLYKSGVRYADFALNHVQGCSHGCLYPCYAMMMKRRCGVVNTYEEWIKPKIVTNAMELLDKELPRLRHKIQRVFLCFTTDPFMYLETGVAELTFEILARLNQAEMPAVVITKGVYPVELATHSFNRDNEYGITLVSVSEDFKNKFEPGASPLKQRIAALRRLHEAGLKTWVSIEPYPPPNIFQQDVKEVLAAVEFVDRIVFGKWNYSRAAGAFKHTKEFYGSMAREVVNFGRRHAIETHIKEGTAVLEFDQAAADEALPVRE